VHSSEIFLTKISKIRPSKDAQKRTASDKYFCLSGNDCRKPAGDVALCHDSLKFATVARMLRPIAWLKQLQISPPRGFKTNASLQFF
jgi:hypothetical protein